MNEIWMVFMILVFGTLSIIMKKEYTPESELNILCYPAVFWKILHMCFFISLAIAIIVFFCFDEAGVVTFFLIVSLANSLGSYFVKRYKIIVEKEKILITPFIGKKREIKISEIEYLEKSCEDSVKIIERGKKAITIDPMLVGTEEFVCLLQRKGVSLRVNNCKIT